MVLNTNLLGDVEDEVQTFLSTLFSTAAIGTDSTAATAGDTALGAQVFSDTIANTDITTADRVIHTLQVGSGEANGNAIQETGAFDSSGDLLLRKILNSITKTSDIQLFIDYTIDITAEEDTS